MPGLKEIRKRIVSVKSTRQITKAMKMVSAAKFRKAQGKILELRPYADKMNSVLSSLSKSVETVHPLLELRPKKTVEIVVFTSDRGLCGAFNTNVIKTALKLIKDIQQEGINISISTIGKKGLDLLKRRGFSIRKSYTGLSGRISYSNAKEIAKDIIENYINESFDEVIIIYNEFKSALVQRVRTSRLLPISSVSSEESAQDKTVDFLYEPSKQEIFNNLLPKNIEVQVFRALLDSGASEEAARMTAMENATKAADDMIASLTLQYNKARQAAITKELMDIVGGVEALKH